MSLWGLAGATFVGSALERQQAGQGVPAWAALCGSRTLGWMEASESPMRAPRIQLQVWLGLAGFGLCGGGYVASLMGDRLWGWITSEGPSFSKL